MDKRLAAVLRKCYIPYQFEKEPDETEWERGIAEGILVPKTITSHDKMLSETKRLSEKIKVEDAARAFLYSLSSGDMRYRSALSSLIWAKALPEHKYTAYRKNYYPEICRICGCPVELKNSVEYDFNRHNVFRFLPPVQYGNVPDFSCLPYVWNDLKEFEKLPQVAAADADYYILNRIFGCAQNLAPNNKAVAYVKEIKRHNILDATSNAIHLILGTLSICGILEGGGKNAYLHGFTDCADRILDLDGLAFHPLTSWRAKDGVNYEAVNEIFGSFSEGRLAPDQAVREDEKSREAMEQYFKRQKKSSASKYFTEGKYIINLTNQERKYLALKAVQSQYDMVVSYSTTYNLHKRTVLFYERNTIVKVIYEEIVVSQENTILRSDYTEYDTRLETEDRKMLLPLTKRGKPKPVTPTNVMAVTPFGCSLYFSLSKNGSSIYVSNRRNRQELAIGEPKRLRKVKSEQDFHEFMEWYISTCPPHYFDRIREIMEMGHQTVKFKIGDVFRCHYDRTQYCYGLIIGRTREIEKWEELPEEHSFRHLMDQPILIRMYDFVSDRPDLTVEDLADIPLRTVEVCADADILWGVHKIIGHKQLEVSDIQFPLAVSPTFDANPHVPPLSARGLTDSAKSRLEPFTQLYVEWGFCQFYIPWKKVTQELKDFVLDSWCPVGGVALGIDFRYCGKSLSEILEDTPENVIQYDLLLPENKEKFELVMRNLGFPENSTYDDFVGKYGGMSRQQYIEKCHS